jgi:hypothetical protein
VSEKGYQAERLESYRLTARIRARDDEDPAGTAELDRQRLDTFRVAGLAERSLPQIGEPGIEQRVSGLNQQVLRTFAGDDPQAVRSSPPPSGCLRQVDLGEKSQVRLQILVVLKRLFDERAEDPASLRLFLVVNLAQFVVGLDGLQGLEIKALARPGSSMHETRQAALRARAQKNDKPVFVKRNRILSKIVAVMTNEFLQFPVGRLPNSLAPSSQRQESRTRFVADASPVVESFFEVTMKLRQIRQLARHGCENLARGIRRLDTFHGRPCCPKEATNADQMAPIEIDTPLGKSCEDRQKRLVENADERTVLQQPVDFSSSRDRFAQRLGIRQRREVENPLASDIARRVLGDEAQETAELECFETFPGDPEADERAH